MALTSDEMLASLPDTFRYGEALQQISERKLRRLIGDGLIASRWRAACTAGVTGWGMRT